VEVVGPSGTSADVTASQYDYDPIVKTVSPTVGTSSGGNTVKITGQDLKGATAVHFGSNDGTNLTVASNRYVADGHGAGRHGRGRRDRYRPGRYQRGHQDQVRI
jgi:hypothetical protein